MANSYESIDQEFQTDNGNESSIGETIGKYLTHWKWFVLSLLLAGTAGYFYVKSQIPVYKIQAEIIIKDNKQSAENDILTQLNVNPSNIVVDNEIQVLKSISLAQRTVASLGLQTSYSTKGNFSRKILYKSLPVRADILSPSKNCYGAEHTIQAINENEVLFDNKKYVLNKPVLTNCGLTLFRRSSDNHSKELVYVTFNSVEAVGMQYASKLTVVPIGKAGSSLSITTEDAVPQRGVDYLNQLVTEYNKASIEDKNINISNTLTFIEDRLKSLVVELNSSEKKVEDYKSANQIANISSQASIFLSNISNVDLQVGKIQLQLSVLRNVENYLKSSAENEVKLPSLSGLEDATVTSLVDQLVQLQVRKTSLLRTIPEENPIVESINDQISSLKKSLDQTIQSLKNSLLASQKQLRSQNNQYQSSISDIPAKERGLLDVMRQQDIKNNLFNFLLQKREETAMSRASTTSDSRTINAARSSGAPIKPVKSTLYLMFFVLGLAIPFGVIFLIEALNNKVRKRSEIERYTKTPILAQLVRSSDAEPLITISKPRSMIAEQIRALRTNLDFIIPDQPGKVILFTSSVSGEGKSFLALNLSASLALTNKKIVVLELDLRKPKLLSTLALEPSIGLSEYLIGKASLDNIVRPVPNVENLSMIESGVIPPNPAELLVNGKLNQLINELKEKFDYILLDAPPVGLVTDAQILSRYADCTFFIVRFNFTLKDHIRLLNEIYRKKVFNNLNVIFNSVEGNGIGYGYRYDYNSGYYEEDTAERKSWIKKLF
jgi:tyrosine-protein kinase Etk/Wzc